MLRPRYLLQPAERYPADPRAVFILVLSVLSGIPLLIVEAAPGSLEASLPQWGIVIWGLGLALGSFLALAGLTRDSVNGIIVEQIGSVMVGAACLFYSGIAFWVLGAFAAGQVVTIVLGWGAACFIRWIQLQLLLNRIHRQKIEADATRVAQSLSILGEG